MKKSQVYILSGVFIASFLGAFIAPKINKSKLVVADVRPGEFRDCGPEGHPDTGELIIVICKE